jgi:hypothetical protein
MNLQAWHTTNNSTLAGCLQWAKQQQLLHACNSIATNHACTCRGQEVKIRLRPAGRESTFYDWNHVLGTMLHELCHNHIGPHNTEFYMLLDELWTEAEELRDKGITGTGEGFDAPSAGRLGAHGFIPTHNPPEHKKADAIRKVGVMMAGGLGGSSNQAVECVCYNRQCQCSSCSSRLGLHCTHQVQASATGLIQHSVHAASAT